MERLFDATDVRILTILRADASRSKAEIGRQIDLAPSAVFARLRRLESNHVIRGYRVELDYGLLGLPLIAFVFVSEKKPALTGKTLAALSSLGIAEEIHRISGEDCFVLKVRSKDTDDLREKLDRIGDIRTVAGVRTHIVLQSVEATAPKLIGSITRNGQV